MLEGVSECTAADRFELRANQMKDLFCSEKTYISHHDVVVCKIRRAVFYC